ncbi:MAG TPA: DUF2199 domain-containing protein [Candidatus Angelobacter sp.]|nr:DUF2199 domain-containing protein [Candidatus Angelobacter sp.]
MFPEQNPDGFFCATCREFHPGLPFSYAADAPDSYVQLKEDERERRAVLGSDQCIIDEKQFFLRGLVELRIIGSTDIFLWGVWASILEKDFDEISEYWETSGREKLIGPYKGRINNALSEYPNTFNLKCTIRIQPVGARPLFYIDEPEHPLAQEQRAGISLHRVQQIASALIHKSPN